ncbi:GUN4 domain-containing protein, partial [Raphidiopsis sp. BLCC-F218]
KTVPTQLKKVTPNNDRLRSLQAEIERLRQKYRDQRSAITLANSGKVDNTPSPLGGRNPVTIAVPRLTDSEMGVDAIAPNDEPVKPQFVPGDTRRNPSSIKLNVPSRRMNPRDSLGKKQGTTVSPALPPFALVDTYVNNANGYIKQGVIRSELGDKRGAIANYDQAIKLNPNLADAYYKRGLVQSELGNKKAAIADFQKAANLYKKQGKKNNHRDALNRIRKIQKRQPRFNSATGTSSRSFYNPNPSQSNSINVNRGNTRYNLGDYRGAIDDYNQAIKLDPNLRYGRLETLLQAQNFKEADLETERIMLAVAKREKEGWLRIEDAEKFPCKELRSIDQLWLKYSRGKFGISVQQQIYQSLGGTKEYNGDVWRSMGDRVGWRQGGEWLSYSQLNFSQTAPSGHLPARWLGWLEGGGGFEFYFPPVQTCRV